MRIGIISGSHREQSESERVARYLERDLRGLQVESYLLSLAGNPLPLWDESMGEGDGEWGKVWSPISGELARCDGFAVVSPEWGGMAPAGLKNLFLLCSAGELAHKPAMIVAVSSGLGGSYPVAELRAGSYKNTRLCYLPDHVIVRNVTQMLQQDQPANDHDAGIRTRINYSLKVLVEYAGAFAAVRASGVIDAKNFPFGM